MFVLVAIFIVYLSSNISRLAPQTTIAVSVLMLFLIISIPLGLPMYGGLSLRMLGIGGGIAREVTLRSYDAGNGHPVIKTVSGCLLIRTGDEIAIHPTSRPKDCQLTQFLHDSFTNRDRWDVEVYPASTIVEIRMLLSPSPPTH